MRIIVGALPKGEGYEFFNQKKKDQRIKELSDPILKRREKTLKTSPNLNIRDLVVSVSVQNLRPKHQGISLKIKLL